MTPIFVDSGGWIALIVEDDNNHALAVKCFLHLTSKKTQLVTSNYVLSETYTWLRYHVGYKEVVQVNELLERATKTERLKIEWVTPESEISHNHSIVTI